MNQVGFRGQICAARHSQTFDVSLIEVSTLDGDEPTVYEFQRSLYRLHQRSVQAS
jgi:hypothetical protein